MGTGTKSFIYLFIYLMHLRVSSNTCQINLTENFADRSKALNYRVVQPAEF